MSNLVRYDAAIAALAECKAVDEVKAWADKAAAMQAYGRMAQDKTLEVDAAEIRIRAERKLGEMLIQQKAEGGLDPAATLKRGPVVVSDDHGKKPAKLADAGISKDLSSRAQKLAAVPEAEFETEVSEWRDRVTQEGERVSAKLVKRGEQEQSRVVPIRPEEPEGFGPDEAELAAAEAEDAANRAAFEKLLAADDKLAAATAEIRRLNHLVATVESQRNGYMNEAAEWKRKYLRAEREQKRRAA